MAELVVIRWRDIPAQVIAKAGRRDQAKILLPDRFQQAIDAAAMRGGARETDDYLAEWRRDDPIPCGDDLKAEAEAVAARIEAEFDDARLATLVRNGGRTPTP